MNAQTLTIISGIVLLIVFALVKLYLKSRTDSRPNEGRGKKD